MLFHDICRFFENQVSMPINLSEQSHSPVLLYCLWLSLSYNDRVEYLGECTVYKARNIYYLSTYRKCSPIPLVEEYASSFS